MDKVALVADDREVEGRVIAALSSAGIPVTAVEWNWVPELHEWQLVVVTSLHNTRGPRATYARIMDALSSSGAYRDIPIRKLFVKSPEDPFAQELVRQTQAHNRGHNTHSQKHTRSWTPAILRGFCPLCWHRRSNTFGTPPGRR